MSDGTILGADLTPTPSPAPAPTPTPSPAPAPSPSPTPSPTPEPTPAPSPTPEPSDDWRASFAGEDEKALAWLGRYASPTAFVQDAKKRFDDFRAGKLRKPLSDEPTAEELEAYRKDFGVPEKPEGYLEQLPSGLVVGEDDRPFVDTFLGKMHEINAPKATVDAALGAYYSILDEQEAALSEANATAKAVGEDALRTEWGADYRRNVNVVKGYVASLPEEIGDVLMGGTGSDGIRLGSNPAVLKWLASLALDANPLATVVPGAGSNQAAAVEEELNALKAKMGDRQSDYWKGPNSAKNQERYRTLIEAQEKMK